MLTRPNRPIRKIGLGGARVESAIPSLWQLQIFEAVARHENLSRASEELLRSQPAVTLSIVKLEEMLEITLFERARTGTYPTEAGVALLVRAQHILASVGRALVEVCNVPEETASGMVSRITRTQMRCLVAISEAPSFNAAAPALGITDASLRRVIRQLERIIGCLLHKNSASGVMTTPVGEEFSRRMAFIASQIELVRDHVAHYNHPKERSIIIGVLLLDPTILLTSAIREMGVGSENVRFAVVSGDYETLLKKLNSGKIDFMIGLLKRPDYAQEIREVPFYCDKYCVVARRDHPLASQGEVSVRDLRKYDWILPPRGSPRRLAFEKVFSDDAIPAANIETYSLSTIRIILMESDMLTVLSLTEMLCEQKIGLLTQLEFDVSGKGPMVGITTRNDWTPNDVQMAFLDAIKRVSSRLQSEYGFESIQSGPFKSSQTKIAQTTPATT